MLLINQNLQTAGGGGTYPTVLASLTPASADGDIIDADTLTNLGLGVNLNPDGTYTITSDTGSLPLQYFTVRLYDASTMTWHVQSPYRVYLNGTIRLADYAGTTTTVTKATLEGLGLTVNVVNQKSTFTANGKVVSTDIPVNSLIASGQTITLFNSTGRGGRRSSRLRLGLGAGI